MRRNLLISTLFFTIVAGIFSVYIFSDAGDVVMPLDDVYIHFQYARQLSEGQPYVYNTGEGATSGATSFIYPYILAIGYLLGFQGLNLGLWSMFVGGVSLFGSMWAIYRLCLTFDAPLWLAILTPISFALTGSVSWHTMSGMETMLIVCFMLWTLLAFIEKRLNLLIMSSILLALTRPEGSIMAAIVAIIYGLCLWLDKLESSNRKQLILLLLPILALVVQPMTNYLMTGSFSASGSQAKSLLGLIPQDWNIIISRILENFLRLWLELLTGYSPSQEIWYSIVLTVPLGIIGLLLLLRQYKHRFLVLLIILWLGSVSGAISTLDTAFWHFKRYQMPLMTLFIPLLIIPLIALLKTDSKTRWLVYAYSAFMLLFAVMTFGTFQNLYKINKDYVRAQPLVMANWLADNTPNDAIIAVHDVGMMRYVGERNTLDIVGLTTPQSAQYWRNGVGAVAEFLLEHQPDYIASYGRGHGYGLYMLADTRLYENLLVEYTVDLDLRTNVALAGNSQAIYEPDWDAIIPDTVQDDVLLDVNVAHIDSEDQVDYQWENDAIVDGFATVAYDFDVIGCGPSHSQLCDIIEGARQLTGEEQFTADLSDITTSDTVILQTRLHPSHAISLEIYVRDTLIDTQWIPQIAGHWLDIKTRIPSNLLQPDSVIQIKPILEDGEVYTPAHHQLVLDSHNHSQPSDNSFASYQDGHVMLTNYEIMQTDREIGIELDWYSDGEASGDYRFFAHIYDEISQSPISQWDGYLGNGTLPLGNWLEGTHHDTIKLNIASLLEGEYQLMVGFYEVETYDRLIPIGESDNITIYGDGRLFLQTLQID
jgi:hypothetical protein